MDVNGAEKGLREEHLSRSVWLLMRKDDMIKKYWGTKSTEIIMQVKKLSLFTIDKRKY